MADSSDTTMAAAADAPAPEITEETSPSKSLEASSPSAEAAAPGVATEKGSTGGAEKPPGGDGSENPGEMSLDFRNAVDADNLETIDACLLDGEDIDAVHTDGCSALLVATKRNNLGVANRLLERNANTEARTPTGDTALCLAAYAGNVDMLNLLLHFGANVEARGEFENRPLHYACMARPGSTMHLEIVRILLLRGASVKQKNKYGNLASQLAHLEECKSYLREMQSNGEEARTRLRMDSARLAAKLHSEELIRQRAAAEKAAQEEAQAAEEQAAREAAREEERQNLLAEIERYKQLEEQRRIEDEERRQREEEEKRRAEEEARLAAEAKGKKKKGKKKK